MSEPRDYVHEAMEITKGRLPVTMIEIEHLRALIELLEQRAETIADLVKARP